MTLAIALGALSLLCLALAVERNMRRRYTITRKSSVGLYRRMIDAQTLEDARLFALANRKDR